ncbi:YHYH protein [Shimia gijangensis]|uniref:YHYH protein n=1 Tax=Shimia gijangensis TaxID=1470563 RepID=A0A1M6FZT8_9RHOB|nr:YHYH protein [Shimia gijangensis]SHJ03258.1 YHYH protein [Shimia gijangensis]
MAGLQNFKIAALAVAIVAGFVAETQAQQNGRPPMRQHTATKAQSIQLVSANRSLKGAKVQETISGATRIIRTTGLPDHAVGRFPNEGNPHAIKAQNKTYKMSANPKVGRARDLKLAQLFGVAVNGVPFDPGAAEFWQGNPRSGWQYEALGGAVLLGVDSNYAHVQPTGTYHYHGLPIGLMQNLSWSKNTASPLIGYAADGFPIYAITAQKNGEIAKMTSSYRLKSGNRPGGRQPGGRHDGAFVQDWTYVKGAGSLDECNGAVVKTADYPQGTYAYFLTDSFPVIPRCLKGKPNSSFMNRPA